MTNFSIFGSCAMGIDMQFHYCSKVIISTQYFHLIWCKCQRPKGKFTRLWSVDQIFFSTNQNEKQKHYILWLITEVQFSNYHLTRIIYFINELDNIMMNKEYPEFEVEEWWRIVGSILKGFMCLPSLLKSTYNMVVVKKSENVYLH